MASSALAPSSLSSFLPLTCLFRCKAITPALSTPTNSELFSPYTSLGTELVEQEHSGEAKVWALAGFYNCCFYHTSFP